PVRATSSARVRAVPSRRSWNISPAPVAREANLRSSSMGQVKHGSTSRCRDQSSGREEVGRDQTPAETNWTLPASDGVGGPPRTSQLRTVASRSRLLLDGCQEAL